MSEWDEKAEDHAAAAIRDPDSAAGAKRSRARGRREGFVWGARWQREALLSDEAVERAALGIHASHDRGDWDEELPVVQDEYLDMARAALAAALGEDESNE